MAGIYYIYVVSFAMFCYLCTSTVVAERMRMGGRTLQFLEGEFWTTKTPSNKTRQPRANHPPTSFIYGRLPFRVATAPCAMMQSTSSAWWRRAARGS